MFRRTRQTLYGAAPKNSDGLRDEGSLDLTPDDLVVLNAPQQQFTQQGANTFGFMCPFFFSVVGQPACLTRSHISLHAFFFQKQHWEVGPFSSTIYVQ